MFKVQIAGEDLKFTPLPELVPDELTGELVAKLAGADDPQQFVVIQMLKDNELLRVVGTGKLCDEFTSELVRH